MEFIVKIDKDLSVATTSSSFETKTINIDFDDFLENICIMQSREFNPSNYVNLDEFKYIKSWISSFTPLSFHQVEGRVEDKTVLSENVGVGLAMCSIEKLWGKAEFMKIDATVKRPDFTAILENGDRLIIESKGTGQIDSKTVVKAFKKAYVQKNVNIGKGFFERIVSVSHLVHDASSVVYLLDPPTDEPRKATVNERMSAKAYNYSKLFSVYGFSELSRYFHLLSRRYIEKNFKNESLSEKINLLDKILNQFTYRYDNKTYYGQIRRINDKNIFLGVDENLLYLETFATFKEKENKVLKYESYKINLSKRGFITIEFNDPKKLGWNIRNNQILNNYDFLTISDIDEMSGIGFENFITYKFESNDFHVEKEGKYSDSGYDLTIKDKKNNILFVIEIKKVIKQNYFKQPILESSVKKRPSGTTRTILITNAVFIRQDINTIDNLLIWDREVIRKLIKRKNILSFIEM